MEDTEYKEFIIPKGHLVIGFSRSSYLDESIFKEAKTFNPDRWSDIELMRTMPFGSGVHKCKGEQFALMTMKTLAYILFTKYDVEMIGEENPPMWGKTLLDVHNPTLVIRKRVEN